MITEREKAINALPEELIAAAKAELSGQEWFDALPSNSLEDDAVFNRAFELQSERRLRKDEDAA